MVYSKRSVDLNLYYGAKYSVFEKAKMLRSRMTKAERVLWEKLRNKQLLGLKFRRQHPIDRWIADFYCHQKKVVIEVDGQIHQFQKDYDIGRQSEIERYGIRVIRFDNHEVLNDIEKVIKEIKEFMAEID